jgi:hypothetical protein
VVEREKAKIGVFITLAESTGPMRTESVKAGFYETTYGKYPRIQIFTVFQEGGERIERRARSTPFLILARNPV